MYQHERAYCACHYNLERAAGIAGNGHYYAVAAPIVAAFLRTGVHARCDNCAIAYLVGAGYGQSIVFVQFNVNRSICRAGKVEREGYGRIFI